MNLTWGRLLFRSVAETSRLSAIRECRKTLKTATVGNLTRGISLSPSKSQSQANCGNSNNSASETHESNDKDGRRGHRNNLALGLGGFSLGFMGFFEKKEKLSPDDELLLEIKRAILAIRESELSKAERHLSNAWKMSEELDRDDVKTQIMDIQANLAFQKGELDKAIRLFQLVTQRLVYHQGYALTDNAVVEISIKLAQMFTLKGQDEEALAGFHYCAETQIEKIEKQGITDEDTLMLAAWSLQSLAQAYMASGTLRDSYNKEVIAKAQDYAQKAYKYSTEAVGPDSQQAIAISTDLATLLAIDGKVDQAIKRLEECEKIAAEKHHFMQAPLRVNTGSLYLQKGDYSEAERICKEAKAIAGKYRDTESLMRAEECITKSDVMNKIKKAKDANHNREELPTKTD